MKWLNDFSFFDQMTANVEGEQPNELRHSIVCETSSGKVRADKFLSELFPEIYRSQIKRAMDAGNIHVNGKVVVKKQRFEPGDQIEVLLIEEISIIPKPVSIPLDVVFEDEDIIVVNKEPGMVTHPGAATGEDTLVHALLAHCDGKLSRMNGEDRPGIVHRLDKDTSGLIIAAKSDKACKGLLEQFKGRDIIKEYLVIVSGVPETKSGTIEEKIGRHPTQRVRMSVIDSGRDARTDWEVLAAGLNAAYVLCRIHTGRTHQIRVHLSYLGYPVIGDVNYGYQASRHAKLRLKAGRPLLHAHRLVLTHPINGESMEFKVDAPDDFQLWLKMIG